MRTMKAEPEFALRRRSGSVFALVPAVRMSLKFIIICMSTKYVYFTLLY